MIVERTMDPLKRRPETWKLEQWLKDTKYDVHSVKTVFDLGARDCIESVELARMFPNADVIAVECNPECLIDCRDRLSIFHEDEDARRRWRRIQLVEKAVNNWTGKCRFWAIDADKTLTTWLDGNLGASSMLKANGSYEFERYAQKRITVPCMTLADMFIYYAKSPGKSVIWQDLQGFEIEALKSAGNYLQYVDLIYSEISLKPAYEGQCLEADMNKFLYDRGYDNVAAWYGDWQGDALYRAA